MKIIPAAMLSSLLLTFAIPPHPLCLAQTPAPNKAAGGTESAESQFQLAKAYLRGQGVPKDPAKAFELMKAAAAQGNAEAIGGMGYFYSSGVVVARDEAQAAEWFRKGAEKGSAKAELNLGKALAGGKGAVKNVKEGLEWIKKAADQRLPEALLAQGLIAFFGQYGQPVDYPRAFPDLLAAAELGNADAQNTVGVMLEEGKGSAPDLSQAVKWFRQAAAQGHVKARANLGRLLWTENKRSDQRVEALAWLMVAADQGEVTAEKLLADRLPEADPAEAVAARNRANELAIR